MSVVLLFYNFKIKLYIYIYMQANSQLLNSAVLFLVTQSLLTLCDPVDYTLPGSSVHGDSPGKNTGVSCHALLQGMFPTQGLNPVLRHYRWILFCLSHQGSPYLCVCVCVCVCVYVYIYIYILILRTPLSLFWGIYRIYITD